jgi:hypothetical protein
MTITNVIIKEQNLDLLKLIPNTYPKVSKEYLGFKAPCVVFEEIGFVIVANTLEEYNFYLDRTADEIVAMKKATKLKQVQEKYEAQRLALMHLPEEHKTWNIQEAEYNAYMLDNLAPTPAIDGLVQGRNTAGDMITKAELIIKIGTAIDSYITAVAIITGTQHGYESLIKACTTQTELDAIII